MDLNSILEKTKNKVKHITTNRTSVHIAHEERPYEPFKETNPSKPPEENKTQHKLDTNQTHSIEKIAHKPNTNSTQASKKTTETEHKLDTKEDTNTNTNYTQKIHNIDTTHSVSTLVGLQKKLLFFVYYSCKKSKNSQSEPLAINNIAELLKIPLGSIKTTMARLEEKNFLKKIFSKNGRGGWSIYEIPELIYRELFHLEIIEMEYKLDTNQTQLEHKLSTKFNT